MRSIALFFLAVLVAHEASAQSPDPTDQPVGAPSATQKDQQTLATPSTTAVNKAVLPNKPRKVYTNEDFDARPRELELHGTRDLLAQVSDCDQNCLNDVSRRVGTPAGSHGEWKKALLRAIDAVKEDVAWQDLLREGLSIQIQSCDLQLQKEQDLRSSNQPESTLEREYEPKFKDIARRIDDVKRRASIRIAAHAAEPYKSQFMQLQMDRVALATCNITISQPQDSDVDNSDNDP